MDIQTQRRLWVEQWKIAGPMLEEQRDREIRAFNWATDWQRVDSLLAMANDVPNRKDRFSSGLVEQQRIFARARA